MKQPKKPFEPIPGYPGYLLSADFQIIGRKGAPLTLKKTPCGQYKFCCVAVPRIAARPPFNDLSTTTLYLHRAIALVHVDGFFTGATVDHLDGNPENNHPSNLEWVTMSENTRRSHARGKRKTVYVRNDPATHPFYEKSRLWAQRLGYELYEYLEMPGEERAELRDYWKQNNPSIKSQPACVL